LVKSEFLEDEKGLIQKVLNSRTFMAFKL